MRHLGLVVWEQGNRSQGEELFQQAASIAQRCQDWREFGLALIRLAGCLIDRGELKEGKSTALRALSIGEEVEDRYIQGLAAYWISVAESKEGNLKSSLEWLDKGEIWARELGWSRALTWYLLRRGANLMEAGRYAEAERYLLRAMETITWDEPRFFAQAKYYLAHTYRKTSRPELARRTAEEVRDLAERIGMGALRKDAEALLRELQE